MQFGYPYLIRFSFFKIQSNPDPVLNCRIRLDRDPETGSCSTLLCGKSGQSHFFTPTLLLFQNFRIRVRVQKLFKFENLTPVQTPANIDPTEIFQCFF